MVFSYIIIYKRGRRRCHIITMHKITCFLDRHFPLKFNIMKGVILYTGLRYIWLNVNLEHVIKVQMEGEV
jgi:hypothetical protein